MASEQPTAGPIVGPWTPPSPGPAARVRKRKYKRALLGICGAMVTLILLSAFVFGLSETTVEQNSFIDSGDEWLDFGLVMTFVGFFALVPFSVLFGIWFRRNWKHQWPFKVALFALGLPIFFLNIGVLVGQAPIEMAAAACWTAAIVASGWAARKLLAPADWGEPQPARIQDTLRPD